MYIMQISTKKKNHYLLQYFGGPRELLSDSLRRDWKGQGPQALERWPRARGGWPQALERWPRACGGWPQDRPRWT